MIILPLYHLAAALRNGNVLAELEKDFRIIPQVLVNPDAVVEEKKSDPNQIGLF